MDDQNKIEILENFTDKIINNQIDCPPEFYEIIDKNFWDLFEDNK